MKVVEEVQSLLLLLRAFAVVFADWHIVVVVAAAVAVDAALSEVSQGAKQELALRWQNSERGATRRAGNNATSLRSS